MSLTTYDPRQVLVTLGAHTVTGYATGTFVEVGRLTDTFSSSSGATGLPLRVKSNDKRGMIQLTLMPNSPSNAYLSSIAVNDEQTNLGTVPFQLKDLGNTTLKSAPCAWVKKIPSKLYSDSSEPVVWELEVDQLNSFIG